MAVALGTRVGPYEIASAIGAGGIGEVYRATDKNLGRTEGTEYTLRMLYCECRGQRDYTGQQDAGSRHETERVPARSVRILDRDLGESVIRGPALKFAYNPRSLHTTNAPRFRCSPRAV